MKNLPGKDDDNKISVENSRVGSKMFSVLTLALSFILSTAFGQAPNISYPSPEIYHPFMPITPISPKNTGGAIPGAAAITLGQLNIGITGMAADTSGNIYIVGTNSTSVTELKGNTFITFGSTLLNPSAIAVDATGNIFIADYGHNNVKEIPAANRKLVEILFSDTKPNGIAVDAADDIYVSSEGGIVEALAGHTTANYVDGSDDVGVAIDGAGNIYTIDNSNFNPVIREILASTRKSVILVNTNLNSPNGIATDTKGNVYYTDNITTASADTESYKAGYVTEIPAGGGATFEAATGLPDVNCVAVDTKGNIFAGKSGASINEAPFGIYNVTPALPAGLTLDHKSGIISGIPLTLTAATNYTITGYNASGTSTTTINIAVNATARPAISYSSPQTFYLNKTSTVSPVNTGGAVPAQRAVTLTPSPVPSYISLSGLALDGTGNIYTGLNYFFHDNVDFVETLPPGGGTAVHITSNFNGPAGIAVDATGNVFVADNGDKVVKEILAGSGSVVTYATGFMSPEGVAFDAAGNLYVSDNVKGAIYKVPAGGGTPVILISGAGLNGPTGICLDSSGNIYIANTKGNNIKKMLAGTTTLVTLATNFTTPTDVAVDAAGNVFVADEGDGLVKRIPVGGSTAETILTDIKFKEPGAIRLDASGNIYVGDWSALAVYEINPGYFVNPTLPTGLNIDEGTGIISGTPSVKNTAPSYTVTAYNSGGTGTATLNLKIVSGTNTSLTGLAISAGTFAPTFNPGTTSYAVYVNNATTSVTFTPTTSDGTAIVTINGSTVVSGTASPAISLAEGANTVHILVDDNSGTTEANYTITITRGTTTDANLQTLKLSRGALSPMFNVNTTSYTDSVANSIVNISVTPTTAIAGATITVNGTAVTSGTASAPISLNIGNNIITIVVTATDGTTTKTYTLTVNRAGAINDLLSTLKISRGALSPAFNTNTTSYTASVVNGVLSITLTPTSQVTTSTITVNGATVASGATSNPIALGVGSNVITTVVTAQDGVTTKTYTVTVTRASGGADDSFDPGISVSKPEETPSLNDDNINVHQAVSPNGDGINDFLQIDGIQAYPDNKLTIMNRSGQMIYQASGYDNATKTFDGHSNKNGQMQLPGTYFYELDYTVKGITKTKTGFLVLGIDLSPKVRKSVKSERRSIG